MEKEKMRLKELIDSIKHEEVVTYLYWLISGIIEKMDG